MIGIGHPNISALHHLPKERWVRLFHSHPGETLAIPIEGGGSRGVLPNMFNVFVSQKRMSILHGIFQKSNKRHLYSASSCTIWRTKHGVVGHIAPCSPRRIKSPILGNGHITPNFSGSNITPAFLGMTTWAKPFY